MPSNSKVILVCLLCVCVLLITLVFSTIKKQEDDPPLTLYSSSHTCNTTIISAYYRIKSKHSYEEYHSWMTNFLSLCDCIVIFVQPDLVDMILTPNTGHTQASTIIPHSPAT